MKLLYDLAILALAVYCAYHAIQGSWWGIAGFLLTAGYLIEDSLQDLRAATSKWAWWASRAAAAGVVLAARRMLHGEWF